MSDHVYRLGWRWRAALTVGSLLLGYGAYVVPYGYWLTTRPVFGGALVNFLLALGSLYAFLYAWVYRVTPDGRYHHCHQCPRTRGSAVPNQNPALPFADCRNRSIAEC